MKTINKMISIATISFLVPVIFSGCTSSGESKELNVTETVAASISGSTSSSEKAMSMSLAAVELKTNMRRYWDDHVVWTRNVIFNIMDNLPGTDQAVKRLMKNQDDIGNAIKPYYGEKAGKDLTALLHIHIALAAEFLKANKMGNIKAAGEANKKWIQNADEISAFLSKANPNWKPEEMKMMMREHLTLTTNEAVARLTKNYDADVIAFDKVDDAILKMSDMLTDGIIKQFPAKFKEPVMKM